MSSARFPLFLPLACVLLAAATALSAQPAGIAITSLRVSGWENLPAEAGTDGAPQIAAFAPDRNPEPWVRLLLERWTQGQGAWVELKDAHSGSPGTAAAAELEVEIDTAGFRTRVALTPPSGRRLEVRSSIHGRQSTALLSALAGDLFFLWAQAGGFALQPARPAPPQGALLALDSLRLLPGWRPEASEPLDCAASAEGPVLLFSDRLLELGRDLDIAPATASDLLLRPPFPAGFRPDRIWLDPLGRPLLFSASTGETLSYAAGLPPERRQTGLRQPVHAAALPKGGLAVLASGRITRVLRLGGRLQREPLALPGGFYAAVEGDAAGQLWVLDLVERRVRILNTRGEEVRSLKPALDPSRLPFPQVFLPLADNGLLLGGAGGLWRFDRWGAPVWQLETVFTGVREALPAFFRVTPLEAAGGLTLYLLDPLSRRLYRFDDAGSSTAPDPSEAPGRASAETPGGGPQAEELPALLARLEAGRAAGGELVQYAMDRGLPLLAWTFLQITMAENAAEARLARLAKARLLRGLVQAADLAEARLRLPEAEAALREAARLTGELRAVDPVEPSYARDLPGLVSRRAHLREELLEPGDQGLQAALQDSGQGALLSLRSTSLFPAEGVSVLYRWDGFPPAAAVKWEKPIRPGYAVRLPLPFPPGAEGYEEQITLSLSLLLAWKQEGKEEQRFLQGAFIADPHEDLAKAR